MVYTLLQSDVDRCSPSKHFKMALCFGSVMQHGGVVSAVLVAGLLFLAVATWGGGAHTDNTLVIKSV